MKTRTRISLFGLAALLAGLGACSAVTSFGGLVGDADASAEASADSSVLDGTMFTADGNVPIDARADADAAVAFPDGSVAFGGHAYLIVITQEQISWDQARALATDAGGHLATLTTAQESTFAEDLVGATPAAVNSDGNGPLIGGYQPSPSTAQEPAGGWAWVTGEPWGFQDWGPTQPDNSSGLENYLELFYGHWNDIQDLEGVRSYMVEFE